ncbi:hypothetical protein BVY02_01665 [bacterium J17]|nr:hypothetical protein BVY02_01665 [bacterium J17]
MKNKDSARAERGANEGANEGAIKHANTSVNRNNVNERIGIYLAGKYLRDIRPTFFINYL